MYIYIWICLASNDNCVVNVNLTDKELFNYVYYLWKIKNKIK